MFGSSFYCFRLEWHLKLKNKIWNNILSLLSLPLSLSPALAYKHYGGNANILLNYF